MNKNSKVNRGIRKEEEIRADIDQMQEKTKSDMPEDESYYDALIKKRIGEALCSEDRSEKLDVEVLHAWVAADRRKRAIRRRRYAAVCACILLVCCGTFGMKMMTDSDDYYAVAGKNDPVTSEKDGNTVIKSGDGDMDENLGADVVVVNDWNMVETAKKTYPELVIPGYIPEGYEFKELKIKITEFNENYTYAYSTKKDTLYLTQTIGTEAKTIKDYGYIMKTNRGVEIRVKEDIQKMGAVVLNEDMVFFIKGDITDEEIINIVENLKR